MSFSIEVAVQGLMYAQLDLNILSNNHTVGFVKRQEFSKHHDSSTGTVVCTSELLEDSDITTESSPSFQIGIRRKCGQSGKALLRGQLRHRPPLLTADS